MTTGFLGAEGTSALVVVLIIVVAVLAVALVFVFMRLRRRRFKVQEAPESAEMTRSHAQSKPEEKQHARIHVQPTITHSTPPLPPAHPPANINANRGGGGGRFDSGEVLPNATMQSVDMDSARAQPAPAQARAEGLLYDDAPARDRPVAQPFRQ